MVEETTFVKLKKGLLELLRGYPDYRFFGKVEYFLKNGQSSIEVLNTDKIIELASEKEEKELNKRLTQEQLILLKKEGKEKPDCWYRLTSKGVDLAVSMINLEHSERILEYAKETRTFNKWIRGLTIGLFIIGIAQLILTYLQNPIF